MNSNFIEIYENAITNETCESLKNEFEYQHSIGNTYSPTNNKDLLDSFDLNLNESDRNEDLLDNQLFHHIDDSLIYHVMKYQEKNQLNNYFLNIDLYDPAGLKDRGVTSFPIEAVMKLFDRSQVIIRKHSVNDGHNHNAYLQEWANTTEAELHRSLVILYFLNDVSGASVDFYHQKLKIQPKEGTLLIFPAYFTHTYKINNINEDMYILKSWVKNN